MSLSGLAIDTAKFSATSVALVAGALDFSAIFTSACGGGFKLLTGQFSEVAEPLMSKSDMILTATAVAAVAGGTRYALGKLFPSKEQPNVSL